MRIAPLSRRRLGGVGGGARQNTIIVGLCEYRHHRHYQQIEQQPQPLELYTPAIFHRSQRLVLVPVLYMTRKLVLDGLSDKHQRGRST